MTGGDDTDGTGVDIGGDEIGGLIPIEGGLPYPPYPPYLLLVCAAGGLCQQMIQNDSDGKSGARLTSLGRPKSAGSGFLAANKGASPFAETSTAARSTTKVAVLIPAISDCCLPSTVKLSGGHCGNQSQA